MRIYKCVVWLCGGEREREKSIEFETGVDNHISIEINDEINAFELIKIELNF